MLKVYVCDVCVCVGVCVCLCVRACVRACIYSLNVLCVYAPMCILLKLVVQSLVFLTYFFKSYRRKTFGGSIRPPSS